MKKTSLSLVAILLLAVPALAQVAPAKSADTSKGKALVDAKGMTLYVFDKDASGKSNCNGPCATNWRPLMANADAKASGDWSIVTRDDGGKQWAYKGKPLPLTLGLKTPNRATLPGTASTMSGTSPRPERDCHSPCQSGRGILHMRNYSLMSAHGPSRQWRDVRIGSEIRTITDTTDGNEKRLSGRSAKA